MTPAAARALARGFLERTRLRQDPTHPATLLLIGSATPAAQANLMVELLTTDRGAMADRSPSQTDVILIDPALPDATTVQAAWQPVFQASHVLRDAEPWRRWPRPLPGLHRVGLYARTGCPAPALRLTVAVGPLASLLPRLALAAEMIALTAAQSDAGLPAWSAPGVAPIALARLLAPGASLLIPREDRGWAEALARAGFSPEAEGSPRSGCAKEQDRASSAPIGTVWRAWRPGRALKRVSAGRLPPTAGQRHQVAIVGAGLAGSACAAVFAGRGWQVTLIDAASAPQAGSGQPLLADHLHLSPDDNLTARLSRHALWLSQAWRQLAPIGRFQMAADDRAHADQRRALAALGPAADALAVAVTAAEAADLTGVRVSRAGLWLPTCGMSAPADLCASWITGHAAITRISGTPVHSLCRAEDAWTLSDAAGRVLARSPVVILANAADAPRLAGLASVRLQARHGRAIAVSAPALRGLRSVLGGGAYACPMGEATALVGLTDPPTLVDRLIEAPDPDGDAARLAEPGDAAEAPPDLVRLSAMLPELGAARGAPRTLRVYEGWRHATPDRLPLIGALPDEPLIRRDAQTFARNDRLALPALPGLYIHAALGARGLLWSVLGAELLVDLAEGCAPPIEADLIRALAPERFLRQALRRARLR